MQSPLICRDSKLTFDVIYHVNKFSFCTHLGTFGHLFGHLRIYEKPMMVSYFLLVFLSTPVYFLKFVFFLVIFSVI